MLCMARQSTKLKEIYMKITTNQRTSLTNHRKHNKVKEHQRKSTNIQQIYQEPIQIEKHQQQI